MFRCNACQRLSEPNEPAVRVVVETRNKVYPPREKAMKRGSGLTARWVSDPGGVGVEIVREELRHERCQNAVT